VISAGSGEVVITTVPPDCGAAAAIEATNMTDIAQASWRRRLNDFIRVLLM
jgi:hypothetical protein